MQTYNWTKYALCESTLTGGLQEEAMAFRVSFLKHYTYSNIQLNKVCTLWKYREWWASSSSKGFQKKFFKTLFTFKHTIEQNMRSVVVQWLLGFKQKQWLAYENFQNNRHIQTYNWTKYAPCESPVSGGLQAEAMAFRSFSKHYTHSNIQLNKVCALWKYSEWWASIRGNGFPKKVFKTWYTFKHTTEQSMRSVKVQWLVGFKQKQGLPEEIFQNNIHIQTYNWKKSALCQSNKVTWVVGFKHKQWLPEEVFQNIVHNQTYNWTKYALCGGALTGGIQAEAMARIRNFSKDYTHANIQLNKVCALWKYTDWWASSRSKGFQKKVFKTIYTFKHTIEQNMRSVKVQWVVGFKQKQGLPEEVFQNNNHIQTYNWTKYAFCGSTLRCGLQGDAMVFRSSFLKHYTHSNIQLNKVCALWKNTEWWASSRSISSHKKFSKTLYTFKHTIEQSMRSVKEHWVVGFKQKH